MKQFRIFAWAAVAVVGLALIILVTTQGGERPVKSEGSDLGGDFVLTDHTGKSFDSRSLRGKYMLIYFGYTFCPDACPASMEKLTIALETLDADGVDTSKFVPVFISVDPERDTAEELAGFKTLYYPSMIALNGSNDDIKAVADLFSVYYKRRDTEGSAASYLMDHMDVIYVMGPDGSYNQIFSSYNTPEMITEKLRKLL